MLEQKVFYNMLEWNFRDSFYHYTRVSLTKLDQRIDTSLIFFLNREFWFKVTLSCMFKCNLCLKYGIFMPLKSVN